MAIDIKKVKDPKQVLNMMDNAKEKMQQSNDDESKAELQQYYKECFGHCVKLKAKEEPGFSNATPIIKGFYEFLNAYELAKIEIKGKKHGGGRLRQMLSNNEKKYNNKQEAVIKTLERLAIKKDPSDGFIFLTKNELYKFTAEYLMLQYEDLFSKDAISSSKYKLSKYLS